MRKALLTTTAAIALGMFGFGMTSASAANFFSPFSPQGNSGAASLFGPANSATNGGNAGSLDNNALGNFSNDGNKKSLALGLGDAATNDGPAVSALGNFDSPVITNAGLAAVTEDSGNTDVHVTLATSHAGGSQFGVSVTNNQTGSLDGGIGAPGLGVGGPSVGAAHGGDCFFGCLGGINVGLGGFGGLGVGVGGTGVGAYPGFYLNNNGSTVGNFTNGSVGVITSEANGNGVAQFNTSIAIGAVASGATLVHP
jgi:hypothetical protein